MSETLNNYVIGRLELAKACVEIETKFNLNSAMMHELLTKQIEIYRRELELDEKSKDQLPRD